MVTTGVTALGWTAAGMTALSVTPIGWTAGMNVTGVTAAGATTTMEASTMPARVVASAMIGSTATTPAEVDAQSERWVRVPEAGPGVIRGARIPCHDIDRGRSVVEAYGGATPIAMPTGMSGVAPVAAIVTEMHRFSVRLRTREQEQERQQAAYREKESSKRKGTLCFCENTGC
jgi:hypothetical protein